MVCSHMYRGRSSYFATGFELIIFKLYVFFLFFKILCFTLSSTGDIYPNKKAHKDFKIFVSLLLSNSMVSQIETVVNRLPQNL